VTTILLVRHGETDWNRDRRWQGHADPPLNETGRRQSEQLAEALLADPPAAVYSSDLRRARETAEIVARRLELPVRIDPRLREVDVGEWSGLTLAEIERLYPEGVRRREAGGTGWERGETYEAMGERVLGALHEIAAAHDGGRVLVVTHGGPMGRVWLACGLSLDDRPRVANCELAQIEVGDGAIARID
jgi:probable phosphoglycerate mutase